VTGRATRLLDLADRLRAAAETTVDELAAGLGVSPRTLRRDLATLRERGLPITGEAGRGGGIRLEGARGVVAIHLSVPEVVALWLGARLARAAAHLPWSRRAEGALTKLLASLPTPRARELRDLCGRIVVGPAASERVRGDLGPLAPELLRLFEEAVRGGVALGFRYRDRESRVTTREVEPHGLAITPPVWYLLGRDVAAGRPRMFRMDRIAAPALRSALRFRPDPSVVRALLPAEVTWEPLMPFPRSGAQL
jgi:predicted DNA-binding transcriptional regulator YafY